MEFLRDDELQRVIEFLFRTEWSAISVSDFKQPNFNLAQDTCQFILGQSNGAHASGGEAECNVLPVEATNRTS
jgi:hypothetical protein